MLENFIGLNINVVFPWLVLSCVLLLEAWLPLRRDWHPTWWIQQSARHLAKLVHPSDLRAQQQQIISGTLAYLLLAVLWLGTFSFFYYFSEFQTVFGAFILGLALFHQPWYKTALLIHQALQRQQTQLAKERLAPWVNRSCQTLSSYGIEKATTEQLWLRQFYSWMGVLLWFILLGPLAALLYRLTTELGHAWPQKYPFWRYFGYPTLKVQQLINLPVYFLCLFVLLILYILKFKRCPPFKSIKLGQTHQPHEVFYPWVASIFNVPLGGPEKYRNKTLRFPRYPCYHPYHHQRYQTPQANFMRPFARQLSFLKLFCFMIYSLGYFLLLV